eukprot:1282054-Rhodomonas_salina.1
MGVGGGTVGTGVVRSWGKDGTEILIGPEWDGTEMERLGWGSDGVVLVVWRHCLVLCWGSHGRSSPRCAPLRWGSQQVQVVVKATGTGPDEWSAREEVSAPIRDPAPA